MAIVVWVVHLVVIGCCTLFVSDKIDGNENLKIVWLVEIVEKINLIETACEMYKLKCCMLKYIASICICFVECVTWWIWKQLDLGWTVHLFAHIMLHALLVWQNKLYYENLKIVWHVSSLIFWKCERNKVSWSQTFENEI